MTQGYPACPYCENGVLVPTSDYFVSWICTMCGSNMTRGRDMYGPAEPVWYTRDGRSLKFLADPKAAAIVAPAVEKPAPAAPEPPAEKKTKAVRVKGKAKR